MNDEFTVQVQAQNRVKIPKNVAEWKAIKPGSFVRLKLIAVVGEDLA